MCPVLEGHLSLLQCGTTTAVGGGGIVVVSLTMEEEFVGYWVYSLTSFPPPSLLSFSSSPPSSLSPFIFFLPPCLLPPSLPPSFRGCEIQGYHRDTLRQAEHGLPVKGFWTGCSGYGGHQLQRSGVRGYCVCVFEGGACMSCFLVVLTHEYSLKTPQQLHNGQCVPAYMYA